MSRVEFVVSWHTGEGRGIIHTDSDAIKNKLVVAIHQTLGFAPYVERLVVPDPASDTSLGPELPYTSTIQVGRALVKHAATQTKRPYKRRQ